MGKDIIQTPAYLSTLQFKSNELVVLKMGWDFERDYFPVNPIIHLFDREGKRLDLVCLNKRTSQGIRILTARGSHYEVELNMKKLPSYIDSIYVSLGSEDDKQSLNGLKDIYVELDNGKEVEVWGITSNKSLYSSTALLSAIERKDLSFDKTSSEKWNFNFVGSQLPPNYQRVHSILDKKSLFTVPTLKLKGLNKIKVDVMKYIISIFE